MNKAGVIQPTYSFLPEYVRKKGMEKEVVWCGHKEERKRWFRVFGACRQGSEALGFGDMLADPRSQMTVTLPSSAAPIPDHQSQHELGKVTKENCGVTPHSLYGFLQERSKSVTFKMCCKLCNHWGIILLDSQF